MFVIIKTCLGGRLVEDALPLNIAVGGSALAGGLVGMRPFLLAALPRAFKGAGFLGVAPRGCLTGRGAP